MPAVFRHAVVVGRASIDALNHANNREFLRWMEEAAVRHSDARGWTTERYVASGASWVASQHRLDYLRPAFEGDALTVWTWIAELQPRTSKRRYLVTRDADGKALATGHTIWAYIDLASGRGVPIPAEVVAAFEVVGDTDPRLDVIGPARRLLRREA
ncbi:MAG: acyl-CoA thioesterase [Burkholderiaceae bacterium]|jgi:acyl-CoA thioester hydrolase|nr:acyl-CoA thioesterase [Burkholderiaceae bacterium]